jgi:branched-chain amino acid transport system permease protein
MRKYILFIIIAFFAMLLIVGPQFLPTYYLGLLTLILIFSLFAMSLDLLLGYTGLPSLGHAAFFGVAGYFTGLLDVKVFHSFWIALASGLVAALICACIFGVVVLRARGHYFLIITLALSQMLWGVAFKWRSVTGGDDGFRGIARPRFDIINWNLGSTIDYYYFVLIAFGIAVIALYLVVHSLFGRVLQGIRENEQRMSALGYNVWLYQYFAFLIAGLFAGFAGILHVYYNGFVSPHEMDVLMSTEAMLMVIIGGAGTLFGPMLGAMLIILLKNLTNIYTMHWLLILGIIYVISVLYVPQGLYRSITRCSQRWL